MAFEMRHVHMAFEMRHVHMTFELRTSLATAVDKRTAPPKAPAPGPATECAGFSLI